MLNNFFSNSVSSSILLGNELSIIFLQSSLYNSGLIKFIFSSKDKFILSIFSSFFFINIFLLIALDIISFKLISLNL